MTPATTSQRLRATAIDLLFLGVLQLAVVLLAQALQRGKDTLDAVPLMRMGMMVDFLLILASGGFELLGTSLGKRIVGLRVLSATGAPPALPLLAQRWAFKYLPLAAGASLSLGAVLLNSGGDSDARQRAVPLFVLSGLFLAGAALDLFSGFQPSGRALHDRLSETAVAPPNLQT